MNPDSILRRHAMEYARIIPDAGEPASLVKLDLSPSNTQLTHEVFDNTDYFSAWVDEVREKAGARFAIGGYGEWRLIYDRSRVFDAGDEPRRFHLGLDIWGPVNTPVLAFMDATIHSLGNHNRHGDYGATVILAHHLPGLSFFSLYGHLCAADLENREPGSVIKKGETVGHFGPPSENGNWPPHLHLQLILDMQGYYGDYPGVCKFSERESYLANCPNPLMITGWESITDVQ